MLNPSATFALAERVAAAARELGFETALIGAAALSVHGYTRGTKDVDFAVLINPYTQLRELRDALEARGLQCELQMPEDDDPLGGILVIREVAPDDPERVDVVEVVNFGNPFRARPSPASAAMARTEPVAGSSLRCVTIEDLVAFKFYAGGLQDFADIQQLLARNPGMDLNSLRAVAAPFDRQGKLEALIESAKALREGGRVGARE